MTRTLSAGEVAHEAGVAEEIIGWLTGIGVLERRRPGPFVFADVVRVQIVGAFLEGGFSPEQVEWAVSEGHLRLDRVDEYLSMEPGPPSGRTFAEFAATAGARAALLPSVYVALGLPEPEPSSSLHTDEEERLRRFLEGWSPAPSDETLLRAARLIAEGTRMATMGWAELLDEQIVGPAQERLYRGEIERFPEEARRSFTTLVHLQPDMMRWLMERYLEQRIVASIVEGFEHFFASRNLSPPPSPTGPPAVVFVDLSGYTRLTEERGDESAVRLATTLQREADAVASANDGRLVKLLGDGAMLRFPDAGSGLEAALALVHSLWVDARIRAHAGVHAGPLIERDLDLFGRTVNLASRIAAAAGPGEVLASEAVERAVEHDALRLEPFEPVRLKGVADPVQLFRASRT